MRADLLVIGGRPAGLATAIAARRKGLSVTVVDAAHPPIDKACGECILPAGVEVLGRLGVRISNEEAFPVRGIRFVDRTTKIEAAFPGLPGLALRRTRLHDTLAARAAELGVRLRWNTPVTRDLALLPHRWVVGADGQNSGVRNAAGLDSGSLPSSRFGFRRHYRIAPWTDYVEVHWGPRCQIYVTPVGANEIGVALLTRDRHLRLDTALTDFPELQARLAAAAVSSPERGAPTVSRRLPRVFVGRTVLVGDASGSVDAITGDGLSLAFRQALALSEALASGGLDAYQSEHARLLRHSGSLAALLLALDRFPRLRTFALRMLALNPKIFAGILTRHLGEGRQVSGEERPYFSAPPRID